MKLTIDNYHTYENKAISNTKVNTFLLSKELYYMKYISGELPEEITQSMFLGKLVDKTIENGSIEWFKNNYFLAVRKKDDPKEFAKQKAMDPDFIVTPDIYKRVIRMTDRIFRSPFFKLYKEQKAQFQVPLSMEKDNIDICGMIDVLTIDKDTMYIDDLKTSRSSAMRNKIAWAYHCQDMGYLRQLAVYGALAQEIHPEIAKVVYRHFVIGSSKSENFPIKLFVIPNELIEGQMDEFMKIAKEITEEQDWIDKLPGWEDAEELPKVLSTNDQGNEEDTMDGMQVIL